MQKILFVSTPDFETSFELAESLTCEPRFVRHDAWAHQRKANVGHLQKLWGSTV